MKLRIYCVTFATILLVFFIVVYSNYRTEIRKSEEFNNTERISSGEAGSDCIMTASPRSGTTESWTKEITSGKKSISLTANIYDLTIVNQSAYEIPTWSMKVVIDNPCYLNNAWCGTVEIHQFRNGTETTQLLDLRNYDRNDIRLDYIMDGQDMMISLAQGDYIVYYPAENVGEYPLSASGGPGEEATIGMIVYRTNDKGQFENYTISYKLNRGLLDSHLQAVFSTLQWTWIILLAAYIASIIALLVSGYLSRKQLARQERVIQETMTVFSNFVDAKDTYTRGHSGRVAEYSRLLAEELGKSEWECKRTYYIALLHDCGKCTVPDEILKKPSRLTDEEFEIIKSHTTNGARMLKDFHSLEGIGDGAHYHHERYDGKGYPSGLAGDEIPEIGRIICVADSFDAMNSSRCYRPKLTPAIIYDELKKCSGTQFDPKMVKAFLKLIDDKKIVMQENCETPAEKQ